MSQSAAVTLATDDDKNAIYKRVTLRLIPFIFICYLFNYLDRVNVGFAKLQMLDALKFSETVYGLGAGIFFIGYVSFGVPGNLILHRLGARRWIAIMMMVWGSLSACMLKGVERAAPMLKFQFRSASVKLHAVRQDAPPLLECLERVTTTEPEDIVAAVLAIPDAGAKAQGGLDPAEKGPRLDLFETA